VFGGIDSREEEEQQQKRVERQTACQDISLGAEELNWVENNGKK
jgi:hypothetical protein